MSTPSSPAQQQTLFTCGPNQDAPMQQSIQASTSCSSRTKEMEKEQLDVKKNERQRIYHKGYQTSRMHFDVYIYF